MKLFVLIISLFAKLPSSAADICDNVTSCDVIQELIGLVQSLQERVAVLEEKTEKIESIDAVFYGVNFWI